MTGTFKKLSALVAAGALGFAMFGVALAATPASDQGVVPTTVAGNITLAGGGGNDQAACAVADGIETGNTGGSDTTDNGVTVTWTYDAGTKEFGFSATGGLVSHAYIKGGSDYNHYNYTGFAGGGVASDGGMFAPDTNNDGNPQGLSHAVFCTVEGEEESAPPSFEESQGAETDEPSDEPSDVPSDEPSDEPSDVPSDEPSDEPSFEQSFAADTEVPTEPPTNTIGGGTSGPADGAWLLVVALGVFLASVVVLTPARVKAR